MPWIMVKKDDEALAWSNEIGWTIDSFDTFTDEERELISLVIDGEWRQVLWEVN
jgi:hypothetical protein